MKESQRWIGDQKIDLTPLFSWWANHAGERPLTAWLHVTGALVETNTWGWTLNARVENSSARDKDGTADQNGSKRIILRNPPFRELAEFQGLISRHNALVKQHESLSTQAKQAGDRAQAISAQQKADRQAHVRSPRTMAVENKNWRAVEKEAKEKLKQVDQDIKSLKEKLAVYPNAETYEVDCFALYSGQKLNGLTVYDHGKGLEAH